MPKLTSQKWDNVFKEYKNGVTYRELCNKYNICRTTLFRKLKKKGILGNRNCFKFNQNLKILTAEDEKIIISLYKNKYTYDEIIKKIKKISSHNTINRIIKKYNIKRTFITKATNKVNHDYFDNIDTPEKSYWIGMLMADGYVHNKRGYVELSLHHNDKDMIEKFKNDLNSDRKINCYNNKCSIKISSRKLINDLKKYGIIQRKSGKEIFPDINFKSDFLRGFFDGDGSVGISKKQKWFRFISSSYIIIDQINNFLIKKGISSKNISKLNSKTPIYSIHYSSYFDCINLYKLIYENSTLFMKRKKEKALEIYSICQQKLNQ